MTTIRAARRFARILPMIAIFGGMITLSYPVLANPEASGRNGTGRGEAPARNLYALSFYKLSRMNDSTLLELVRQPNAHVDVKVEGVAGRYSIGILVRSMRHNRGRTNRLIERLDNASSEAERKDIIFGLLDVHRRKLEEDRRQLDALQIKLQSESRLRRNFNPYRYDVDHQDPDVAKFHRMRKSVNEYQSYVSLLGHMTLGY